MCGVLCVDCSTQCWRCSSSSPKSLALRCRPASDNTCVHLYTPSTLHDAQSTSQQARLPQTDRAAPRCVNCYTTVGTSCTTNSQQIEVMELWRYGWRTCSKVRARWVYDIDRPDRARRPSYKCCQLARPSMSSVDNTIDLPWQFFLIQSSRQSSRGKCPYFWR